MLEFYDVVAIGLIGFFALLCIIAWKGLDR